MMAASGLNTHLDAKIAAKVIELEHEKGLAVEREDYIAAQQIKEAVEQLRAAGEKVALLEDRWGCGLSLFVLARSLLAGWIS